MLFIQTLMCSLAARSLALLDESKFNGFVNLMIQPVVKHAPQTDSEAEHGKEVGRFPQALELLQPSLDPELVKYEVVTPALTGNYTFAASDTLAVLSRELTNGFMSLYPSLTMQVVGPYAGSYGAIELINKTIDGVFVSRELKPSDLTSFQKAFGYPPTSIPILGGSYRQFGFLDAMAFIVHKDNPIEYLSFDQLDSILSTTLARTGKPVRTWGEVGVSGALSNKRIKIYGLQPWNGFEEFIRQRILSYGGIRGQWRIGNSSDQEKDPDVQWDGTIFNASMHVANDPAGLAYTGLAYIDHAVKILGTYNVSTDMPVAPTYDSIALGTWPLSRLVYFNLNRDPKKPMDPILKEFLKFILSANGQKAVLQQGIFLPFRATQQAAMLQMLK